MKKIFLVVLLACFVLVCTQAQPVGSLNVFSETGEKFYLFLDGIKQNNDAQSNIRIQGLPDLYYSAKIVFSDASIAPVTKNNLYVSDGDDVMRDASYRVRREKGGKAKIVFFSMVPVSQDYIPPAGQYVYYFGQPSAPESKQLVEKKNVLPVNAPGGSLTIFSPNGEKFYLFLDGKKQNETPQSNVRIEGLPELYYNAKIVFQNPGIWPIIKNNLYVSDGDDVLMDAAYRIRRDKSGKVKLNFFSIKPVQQNFVPPAGMYVYQYGKPASQANTAIAKSLPAPVKPVEKVIPAGTAKKSGNAKPSTDKTLAAKPATVKKSPAGNIAANTNAKKANTVDSIVGKKAAITATTTAKNASKPSSPVKETPVAKKCNGWPMGRADLSAARKTIEEAGQDESRFTVAREIISSNCLMASQVTELCSLFKSEKLKLEFAKYAYSFTTDRKNYGDVTRAISSDAGRKELAKFISSSL